MNFYFNITQIILSILLIAAVLLQQRGSGLGSAFGGGDQINTARRGAEKFLYAATIILAVLFVAVAVFRLIA